jgi:hypothetical protein
MLKNGKKYKEYGLRNWGGGGRQTLKVTSEKIRIKLLKGTDKW